MGNGDMLPVKLLVSLHNANSDARTALLPTNGQYGAFNERLSLITWLDQSEPQ
jgi:adenine C2-methylase RlmN of 23S rRNA A2503 and tRNA A37